MLLVDKPGQMRSLYDDFAEQYYRKKVAAICYYLLTSCYKYTNKNLYKKIS